MVFPGGFVKVVASGRLYGGDEIWTTSLSLGGAFSDESGLSTDVEGYAAAFRAWMGRQGSRIAQVATLDLVKANGVGPDGRYISQTGTIQFPLEPPQIGGVGGTGLPAQCSAAISLTSAIARGPGSKGRFYPPCLASAVGADGRLDEADAAAIAQSAVALINAINAVNGDRQVVNASQAGAGAFRPVTGVRVGRVVDTQRRRRNALAEEYVVRPLAEG